MQRTPVPTQFREELRKATQPQLDWIKRMIEGKDLSPLESEKREWCLKALTEDTWETETTSITFRKAGPIIDTLKKLDWRPREATKSAGQPHRAGDVPDGYYALKNVDGHKNEVAFFRLRSPKHGNWVGYQFVDQVVGHGKRYPVKGDAREKIYKLINEQGVNEARQLYGQEIGACGRCGRELTDDLSRSRGIGPDCWGKL